MTERTEARRRALHRWTLNVHMYGGLIFSSYLLIYGVSSIRFNHERWRGPSPRQTVTWSRMVSWPEAAEPHERAVLIRDQLGFGGVVGPPAVSEAGDLDFQVFRPGKSYRVRASRDGGTAEVTERRMGIMATLDALHGAGAVSGVGVMRVWWLMTEASWLFMLFSAASGVYLWARRGSGGMRWVSVAGAAAGFALLTRLVIG